MIDLIVKATENFSSHQLGFDCLVSDKSPEMRTIVAYLDITTQSSNNYRVYLACEETLIQSIAELFLGEESSDEQTLIDMALETVNMVVGSAKVLSEESADPFSIATPHFHKIGVFDEPCSFSRSLQIDEKSMIVAIKEI